MSQMTFENPYVTQLRGQSARRQRRLSYGSSILDTLMAQRAAAPTSPGANAPVVSSNSSSPNVGKIAATGNVSRIIQAGMAKRGTPYMWGGTGKGGFDCSGLVQWMYGKYGIKLPRTSQQQASAGRAVSAGQARAGDLVVWNEPGHHHVGVYLGNGMYLNAPHTGDVVKVAKVNLSGATTIRRIVG